MRPRRYGDGRRQLSEAVAVIFERRAYTFRPERIPDFWQAQVRWNTGATFARLRAHNLSYFEVLAGSAEQVVHLYRYDDLNQWDEVYADLYAHHAPQYFVEARRFMLAQENAIYRPAPVPDLDLGPDGVRTPFARHLDPDSVLVTESTMRLSPGGLPAIWSAYEEYCSGALDLAQRRLLGTYFVLIGRFHTIREYRWHADLTQLDAFRQERSHNAAHARFVAACREVALGTQMTLLRPAPLASHRSLFAEVFGDAPEPGQPAGAP